MHQEKNEQEYFTELKGRAAQLDGQQQELAQHVMELGRIHYIREDEEPFNECQRILKVQAEASGEPLFKPLAEVLRQLIGTTAGDVFTYITEHVTEYPYSTGYERKPFRTSDITFHTSRIYKRMVQLIRMDWIGFSLIDYLTKKDYEHGNDYRIQETISDWIAYELDNGNPQVLEALKGIVYGDNQTALLTRAMIKGMLLSHQEENYHMIGELLAAAKLQEGLRQSIVEQMDEGTPEALVYLLKVIIDQGFIRYSSVVRALAVWTGMGLESANQRVVRQLIEQAYEALTKSELRQEWLTSANANEVYMSLWATAVHEERDLYGQVRQVMEQGAPYQKIVALYVLSNSENKDVRLGIAREYLNETDPELQYWVLTNYTSNYFYEWVEGGTVADRIVKVVRTPLLKNKEERRKDFERLHALFEQMKKGESTEPSKVLDFVNVYHRSDAPIQKMLYLVSYDMDATWIGEIVALKDQISPDLRGELLNHFVQNPDDTVQREFIFSSLSDKSMSIREFAVAKAHKLTLAEEEMQQMEGLLKLKTGSLRQSVIGVLLVQPDKSLNGSLERLLRAKAELQRLGGLEILTKIYADPERAEQYETLQPLADIIQQPTAKEEQLLSKLGQEDAYTGTNGFGLYEPAAKEAWLEQQPDLGDFRLSDVFVGSLEKMKQFLSGLNELVHQHRDVEYTAEYYSGYKETLLIGANFRTVRLAQPNEEAVSMLSLYPLHEEWSRYLQESDMEASELLELVLYDRLESMDQTLDRYYRYFSNHNMDYSELSKHKLLEGWRKDFAEQMYPLDRINEMQRWIAELTYNDQVSTLINAYFLDTPGDKTFDTIDFSLNTLMQAMSKDRPAEDMGMLHLLSSPWIGLEKGRVYDDESFKRFFHTFVNYNELAGVLNHFYSPLELEDYFKAYEKGLIGVGEVYRELLAGSDSRRHMSSLTNARNTWIASNPEFLEIRRTVIDRLLEVELVRGDLPTEATPKVMGLSRIEGMDYFLRILDGLDKETFVRGYVYGYGDRITKKESFSHLLKACYPRDGEDSFLLKEKLSNAKITDKRLLEAAMYAPQWIEIVADYLGWEGLRSAAWYFHAHINEGFSAEKETIVAHYSPIAPQDFNDGAFDIHWFHEAYETLGEERFDLLYDCAKYISAGANHRRSQLFADATLGKLKLNEMKKSVEDKRNKEHLLTYSLIPLVKPPEPDVRERYDFIQKFLEQSKKFGAQRKASEALVSRIALGNLARNAGYDDVTRLVWDMEARKLEDLRSYFEPHALEEATTIQLVIDEEGTAEIEIVSKGKALKSIPARFKKDEYVAALKELKGDLVDQYRRARKELERSMESGTAFMMKELTGLLGNPVLAPLVRTLVFKAGDRLGYFNEDTSGLADPSGQQYPVGEEDKLIIAHPLHLYESGRWSDFQKDLFDRQIRQPFKQVFRELYLPNADERASAIVSRRYAGHQVQPNKTVALLKGRQWTVSYEEGLQKVYYAENLIANLYAMADWFSPADTEAPTLEMIQFFDRTTYKSVPLEEVPPVLFSEVMRDVDLVVSVAHVGGVDPEASLTTIEMRSVIVQESLRLLKISNVRLDGNYARVDGSLGEYAVHLGSGGVYKQAKGALHIIPVHSQHRGRIFLPFLDEDPRTAEILSKIVLLAEDQKIKDPQILTQLQA
ncbi:hypothetical protein ASL14_06975 [Paenibacillus sp. IHB B 3084]|uniref:DUF4132 domain-containing protein n=1 Tax=Paenibacillus sp. IHB B 3084 TaxID=867076 RepID=UPI0007213CF3|nr:DUF4132 domain-containing protein [Paenibacillus sp. IHB B 3084]ALP35949.1 hypothetical protein ASL14_06975 [Paenibacillus sp. IHB B 3084]